MSRKMSRNVEKRGVHAAGLPLEPGGTGSKLSYRSQHAQRSGERDRAGSSHTCLRRIAAGRKWVRSACPISPWFVVNFDLSTTSTRANWLRSALFCHRDLPASHSLATDYWPLFPRHCSPAPRLTPHAPRLTPHDARASGVGPCADPPPLATAIHRPPD